jgi:pimeloyl-ACP methyl ester carboxylesterase
VVIRVAAFEPRVRALIPDGPLIDPAAIVSRAQRFILGRLPGALLDALVEHRLRRADLLKNFIRYGGWVRGENFSSFARVLRLDYSAYDLRPYLDRISCPVLSLVGRPESRSCPREVASERLPAVLGGRAIMAIWRRPEPLTESEFAALTVPGMPSAGARLAKLERGGVLSYFEFGDPGGTPLIALHGLSVSGLAFASHDAFFRARKLRCIAPNLVGGLADPDPRSRLADFATAITELADRLGLETFQIVGVSYGTLTALALAAAVPRRVERAGLFGPVLPGPWTVGHPELTKGARGNEQRLWLTARWFPALLYPLTALYGRFPTRVRIRANVDDQLSDEEREMLAPGHPFHAQLATLLDECGQRGFWYLALGTEVGWGRDPGFTLEQVDGGGVPLFLSTGARDNVHLPSAAKHLNQRVRRSTLEIVPGQGRFGCMGPPLEAGLERYLESGALEGQRLAFQPAPGGDPSASAE